MGDTKTRTRRSRRSHVMYDKRNSDKVEKSDTDQILDCSPDTIIEQNKRLKNSQHSEVRRVTRSNGSQDCNDDLHIVPLEHPEGVVTLENESMKMSKSETRN